MSLLLLAWIFSPLLIIDSVLRFGLLCLRALGRESRSEQQTEVSGSFVVLLPANNEEGTIGLTVATLRSQLPELSGGALWVIADNCRDATALEAAASGAEVAVRAEGARSKGAAIAWWLQKHLDAWKDKRAIVILDADSRLSPGSLQTLVHAIYRGADAAQAFVAPVAVTSLGRLAGYSEVLMQRIDDQARLRQGWPVPLRGTGMAFRAELLAELAPALHTSTEDFELNVLLAARGAKVKFVPEAVVFDPKPQSSGGAARQRARWLRGQLQVLGDYRREIFRGFKSGGIGTWQLLLLLALRPKMLFLAARMLALPTVLWWLAAAGLALDLVYYLSVFLFVSDSRRYLIDILALPRYAMLWLRTLSMAAFHRDWLRGGR